MDVTKECLYRAIEAAQPGNRLGDVGYAVESYAKSFGFAVVRDYVGHGVGRKLHESPSIPNYGTPGHGLKLLPGMTLAIEPMINEGTPEFFVDEDNGWTVYTLDDGLSAQIEYMVLVTEKGVEVLTK